MRLPDFKVEQWMNDYENDAIYNMTDTCVKSLTLQELLDLEDFDFSNLILDYGQITGDIELKKEILSLYEHGTIDNIMVMNTEDDAAYFKRAESLLKQVLQQQTTDLDAISGATFSSECGSWILAVCGCSKITWV